MLYQEDELAFVAKAKEYLRQIEGNKKVILTKFLTQREQAIIEDLFRYSFADIHFFGGFEGAERKRCLILDPDLPMVESMFDISCYRIDYNKRYLDLKHPNVLGTLMSLKLDRALFGDIVIGDQAYFFTTKEIESIILQEFTMINHVPISLTLDENPEIQNPEAEPREVIVPSMRIDSIISHVFHLSRSEAEKLIEGQVVYQNFQVVLSKAQTCEIGDIISVRRYGRFTIKELIRKTKSNKIVLTVTLP